MALPTAGLQRASGEARITLKNRKGVTVIEDLYQEGAAKMRLPRPLPGAAAEAVLINTAGGLTGGDRMNWRIDAGTRTRAAVTTQACERVYRALSGEPARVASHLSIGEAARLDWLPQETILFDGCALARTLDVNLAAGATLLVAEAIVFGREAMKEDVRHASFHDRWRIRRDGRLIFADDLRFDGAVAQQLARAAIGNGARAIATVGYFGAGAEARLEAVRARLPQVAASAFDGKLLARLAAGDSYSLRKSLIPLLELLCAGGSLPKAWAL